MPLLEQSQQKACATNGALICTVVQCIFQAAIAFGLPLGSAAYGGGSETLATSLRIVSGVATLVYLFFGSVILQVAEQQDFGYSVRFCRRALTFWVGFLYFETVLNFASSSPWERFLWSPFLLIYATCSLVLLRSLSDIHQSRDGLSEEDHLFSASNSQ